MRVGISLPVRELGDDLGAIREFALLAEALGYTHLRVPDQVIRPNSGHLHEPMTLLAWLAGVTESIELCPSVIVLPARQTALFAKQAAEVDHLCGGRLRLGIGVGTSADEFNALGADFHTRGRKCTEQMRLLSRLWTEDEVTFDGEFHSIDKLGINPLPLQRPIPMWIGGSSDPVPAVRRRIAECSDGWFALCSPEAFRAIQEDILTLADAFGRRDNISAESGVGVPGRTREEWTGLVRERAASGVTHLCMRTLGGQLDAAGHLDLAREIYQTLAEML